jgi:hypothetical protein
VGSFSQYTSFLEIAFGVNLLFGAWEGIYEKLSQISRDSRSKGERTLETAKVDVGQREDITRHRRRCDACRTWIRRVGRSFGLLIATTIAVSLLLVTPEQSVGRWGFFLIGGSGALVPSLMAIMVIVDKAYTAWITTQENAAVREAVDEQARAASKASEIASELPKE